MNQAPSPFTEHSLSIVELPAVLTHLFDRAQRPLLPEAQNSAAGLFVRYLRRKAGRGLAVIYAVDERNAANKGTNDPTRSVSLTLDEQALDGSRIRFTAQQASDTPLDLLPSGVLYSPDLGLSVQTFPADAHLPALAQSCDTSPGSPVFEGLQTAIQTLLQDSQWRVTAAAAIPVRYKPASRCVIRYQLQIEHSASAQQHLLYLFGKVYADPAQAGGVQTLQQQLYTEQAQKGDLPLLPRPLGLLESLGLAFNEAVQPPHPHENGDEWTVLRTGTRALQPRIERGRGGIVSKIIVPQEELLLTGQALARLHTSSIVPGADTLRPGKKEAKRARERAALIAQRNPSQADEVQRLMQILALQLEHLQPEEYRPAHGGFKASQLLFHSHKVFVVDFDGFCLADAALDAGYFLAYLRPSGLWYNRPAMREWFNEAADVFRHAYREAMLQRGVAPATLDGILARSRFYEAALIFKIATRRVNRLNSPRTQELSAMLQEIASCLASEARRD